MSEENKTLSAEEQQAILEKYDPESATRKLTGVFAWIVFFGLLAFSLFQLYTAIVSVFTAQIQRSVHLGFALSLIFLLFPITKNKKKTGKWQVSPLDIILALLSIAVGAYWPLFMEDIAMRVGILTTTDFAIGLIAILLVLEATRRAVGLPITIIAVVFMLYGLFGQYMPGFLQHGGLSLERLVQTMFFTTEGILGTPLGVSATFIFLFLLFGSFLIQTGVGQYFNDLSAAIAGKRVGGPAKVAIFSSALQGTISGSSVANVVTSGAFTIPMMKKLGYKREFAGAVEAAASTGGQLMPPIMGAAAFLMVEFIGNGITYWDIAKAAAIPAVLYFTGIWIMTHFEAKRLGLRGLKEEEMPNRKEVLKKIYLLLPIVAIVVLLMTGVPVMHAALYSILIAIGAGFINKETRMGPKAIVLALVDGARSALSVAAATAAAGIIVGIVTKTGLGLTLANGLIDLAGGAIIPTLFLTMIAALILGMGSPTTANYVITSTIAAPAIIFLGYPDLAAHLFVFYFGIIADITPPVALAAIAAAGVSGGEPIKTGVISAKLAIAAFIIPYIFVLQPQMLLIDTTLPEIAWVVFTAVSGMIAIGAGMIGFWMRKLHWIERLLAIAAGLLLIYPEGISDTIGLILFAGLFAIQLFMKKDKDQNLPQQA
ncbi:TRAP transporter permease [Metabacillus idriensis]|uniref:TRAP transporter fused permease subunit n=1 Tax=Metabacillus idriensis TaxID=324768 RepID=A0A6I2M7R7_9BACI|nr:TRAP transporter permease [Metabacillus idriensis]MCM3595057.1 TRAP transporter permease [Metabacillus idriensis]MRX52916.1 TRAP transporter fused permease subunit [Metabacillus idriensis]OHR65541.1 C4-dicarboxylate ABC transporter [Bacillus sp. HMSC76G11]